MEGLRSRERKCEQRETTENRCDSTDAGGGTEPASTVAAGGGAEWPSNRIGGAKPASSQGRTSSPFCPHAVSGTRKMRMI